MTAPAQAFAAVMNEEHCAARTFVRQVLSPAGVQPEQLSAWQSVTQPVSWLHVAETNDDAQAISPSRFAKLTLNGVRQVPQFALVAARNE